MFWPVYLDFGRGFDTFAVLLVRLGMIRLHVPLAASRALRNTRSTRFSLISRLDVHVLILR
jgi:hypothetical protein